MRVQNLRDPHVTPVWDAFGPFGPTHRRPTSPPSAGTSTPLPLSASLGVSPLRPPPLSFTFLSTPLSSSGKNKDPSTSPGFGTGVQ